MQLVVLHERLQLVHCDLKPINMVVVEKEDKTFQLVFIDLSHSGVFLFGQIIEQVTQLKRKGEL